MRRAGEGEVRLSVRTTEYEAMMDRLQAGFSLLAYALIVSALIVGAAFLVNRPGLSRLEEVGARVLLAALASIGWLFVSLLRTELVARGAPLVALRGSAGLSTGRRAARRGTLRGLAARPRARPAREW